MLNADPARNLFVNDKALVRYGLALPFETVSLVLGQFAYRSVYCNVRFVHFGFIFKVSDYGIFARYHARS